MPQAKLTTRFLHPICCLEALDHTPRSAICCNSSTRILKLARLLLDGEKQLKTVSIVGFAGLGKTTLALEVYRQIEAEFECHARVTMSRNPRMKQLLQHLLSQVRQEPNMPQDSEASLEPEQLISEITEHLQDKR